MFESVGPLGFGEVGLDIVAGSETAGFGDKSAQGDPAMGRVASFQIAERLEVADIAALYIMT